MNENESKYYFHKSYLIIFHTVHLNPKNGCKLRKSYCLPRALYHLFSIGNDRVRQKKGR